MSQVYDSGDYDAILELIKQPGPGVVLLMSRIQSELQRRRVELEDAKLEDFQHIRGQIQALRTVLAIPEILRDEIAATLGARR